MSIPAPRRIITAHTPSGGVITTDDTLPVQNFAPGLAASVAFAQPTYESDPMTALDTKDAGPAGLVQAGGINARWLDIDAGATVPTHFTDSVDYVVITHGELDLEFIDGSKVTANTGDLVIQLGNIHTWKNVSSAPARFFAVLVGSKPALVNGKTLDQEPFNATRF